MKKQLVTLIGALTLGATLPAFAGPDFLAIERARKARPRHWCCRSTTVCAL